jgi:uncharacterized membrane protein
MTDQKEKRVSSKWRSSFFVSLAGNIAIVGIVIGAVLGGHGRPDEPRSAARMGGVGQVVRALPRDDRRALGQAMRQFQEDNLATTGTPAAQREEWIVALSVQPFDAAILRDLVAVQMANPVERSRIGGDLLIEKITAMNDAERAKMVKNLRRYGERGGLN